MTASAEAALKVIQLSTPTAKQSWRRLDQRIYAALADVDESLNQIDGRAGLRRCFELIGLRNSPEQQKLAEAAEAERFDRIRRGA